MPLNVKYLFLVSSLLSSSLYADQVDDWIENIEYPDYEIFQLKQGDAKDKYKHYDFSSLMIPRTDFLGYIEPNYRRLKITLTSVTKDPKATERYNVRGYSVVKGNKCDFSGEVAVYQVREYEKLHLGIDDEYKDAGIKAQGVMLGKYTFNENSTQKYSGSFQGLMTLYWYVDSNDQLVYDNIRDYADNYRNNQYVGTWTRYGSSKSKTANWGEYRIPFSKYLDIGAGEFSVNPVYENQGWSDYME